LGEEKGKTHKKGGRRTSYSDYAREKKGKVDPSLNLERKKTSNDEKKKRFLSWNQGKRERKSTVSCGACTEKKKKELKRGTKNGNTFLFWGEEKEKPHDAERGKKRLEQGGEEKNSRPTSCLLQVN